MKIILATDHAGFALKEFLKKELIKDGYDVIDCGAPAYDPEDDYPVFIAAGCHTLLKEMADEKNGESPETRAKAIFIGGSGQGEAMVANRFKGIRATVYYGEDLVPANGKPNEILFLSHEHNEANALSLGARFLTETQALGAVLLWLTNWSHGKKEIEPKHLRRIALIDTLTP